MGQWTTETPSKPGPYWVRSANGEVELGIYEGGYAIDVYTEEFGFLPYTLNSFVEFKSALGGETKESVK